MSKQFNSIRIDGKTIHTEQEFVLECLKQLNLEALNLELISELSSQLIKRSLNVDIHWFNSQDSTLVMVRKSDYPLDKLPSSGSNMERDIVMEIVWAKQSLLEKAKELLEGLENVILFFE